MRCLIIALILALAPAAWAVNLLGTEATFGWNQPGELQVEGWEVLVSRDGAVADGWQVVTEPVFTVSGVPDETIQITVRAFIGDVRSELSEPSDPITFRVLETPGAVQVKCPEGQTFTPTGVDDWWSCQ